MYFILQHKCFKVLSVIVTKVEKNILMIYVVRLSIYIIGNQQPSSQEKVQRLSRKRVGNYPEVAASIENMDEDIVQRRIYEHLWNYLLCL